MLTVLAWIGIVLAILAMVVGIVACLVGLPGSVLVLVTGFILSASTHWERPPWWVVLIFLGLTVVAETVPGERSARAARRRAPSGR